MALPYISFFATLTSIPVAALQRQILRPRSSSAWWLAGSVGAWLPMWLVVSLPEAETSSLSMLNTASLIMPFIGSILAAAFQSSLLPAILPSWWIPASVLAWCGPIYILSSAVIPTGAFDAIGALQNGGNLLVLSAAGVAIVAGLTVLTMSHFARRSFHLGSGRTMRRPHFRACDGVEAVSVYAGMEELSESAEHKLLRDVEKSLVRRAHVSLSYDTGDVPDEGPSAPSGSLGLVIEEAPAPPQPDPGFAVEESPSAPPRDLSFLGQIAVGSGAWADGGSVLSVLKPFFEHVPTLVVRFQRSGKEAEITKKSFRPEAIQQTINALDSLGEGRPGEATSSSPLDES